MRLVLLHGRKDPRQEMEDWGFDYPDIEDVKAIHVTYQATFIVHFKSVKAALKAFGQTKWYAGEDTALEMAWMDDLVEVTTPEGEKQYFGDWELQEDD